MFKKTLNKAERPFARSFIRVRQRFNVQGETRKRTANNSKHCSK